MMLSRIAWDDARLHDSLLLCTDYDQYIFRNNDCMNDDLYEFRYEQRGATYTMRRWHNGTERNFSGPTSNMPEWLRAILDTAKVAGAIKPIATPPPEVILWFRTDTSHNLIEFIEMK